MVSLNKISIIDLFAGPGGLGEGFSRLQRDGESVFDIKLSIEKDPNAHKTLLLRSFFRKFKPEKHPEEYYDVLKATSIYERDRLLKLLYSKYSKEYESAIKEAYLAELGSINFPDNVIDDKIQSCLKDDNRAWVLIGGPPCQAYSLVGRSRVGGINKDDHRVFLYKEYLRIIAKHQPSVFVMENVKGLLSAKLDNQSVFDNILSDLQEPQSVFPEYNSRKYKIFSLVKEPSSFSYNNNPEYFNHNDFLIKSEEYGIPQKRHRVILLGIRDDIDKIPKILKKFEKTTTLKDIIDDLPKIRSGISRSLEIKNDYNTVKRAYKKEDKSDKNWQEIILGCYNEIRRWNDFKGFDFEESSFNFKNGIGSEFIKEATKVSYFPEKDWFLDKKLKGTINHISRSHLKEDLRRYLFSSMYTNVNNEFPKVNEFINHSETLVPDHKNVNSGKFTDRFRVQKPNEPATTITSHISKDGHYFIHYDYKQCRSLTVREAARVQTFPDNYLFCGNRTSQFHQVGNAVPPYLAYKISEIVYNILE
ncbi:MAG: DNA cytosine methyltransferase [Candidatus Delongbacteria bacterium]|nr:DNA cytosine methyltransferase [Candidatus Delongbacteria bacterium]MBN2836639.1 DNA cytosine methyltransferase [Candidatus Delongbacteria bacterium]